MFAFVFVFAASIELATETSCPGAGAVRASLETLDLEGAAERSATAHWAAGGEHLHLVVRTASSATAGAETIERDLPLGPCAELADQVALVIERATAPLGFRAAPLSLAFSRRSAKIGLHAGALMLAGSYAAFGIHLGAEIWPIDAAYGVVVIAEAVPARRFSFLARNSTQAVDVARYAFGGGLAARHRFTGAIEAGFSAALLAELVHTDFGGSVREAEPVDGRIGGRAGAFGRLVLYGPFTLNADVGLRILPERRYRARPATELVVLNPFELELAVGVGAIFF